MLDDGEAQRRLGYHPATETTRPVYELNRALAITAFTAWNQVLPPGREAALALTALQEALMWANAAVACNAGTDWQPPVVDVTDALDELLELIEGPLHMRSRLVGGGGPVDSGSGGDIGPEDGSGGPAEPGSGVTVPAEGISATHLTPEQVQALVERSGPRGPADDIARRSGGETVTLDQLADGDLLDQRIGRAVSARIGPVEPLEAPFEGDGGPCPACGRYVARVLLDGHLEVHRRAGWDGR